MWKLLTAFRFLLFSSLLLSLVASSCISNTYSLEETKGDISFQPNIIDSVNVTFSNSRFRFEWLNNSMELALFTVSEDFEFELEVEEDKTKLKVKVDGEEIEREVESTVIIDRSDSDVTWGMDIWNIPDVIADNIDCLLWKIEEATFTPKLLEGLNHIELADNLYMHYQDLEEYGFTVNHLSNYTTQILNVTGKATLFLDPIAWAPPTITVTGFTEGVPCTFYDVWLASSTQGWGAVGNMDNMQYFFNGSKLKIASGGWFADTRVQASFNTTNEIAIFNDSSHFRLGVLADSVNYVTSGGCHILFDLSGGAQDIAYYADANSDTWFYGSILESQSHQSLIYIYHATAEAWFYETVFSGMQIKAFNAETNFNRVTQTSGAFGTNTGCVSITDGTFNDFTVEGNQYTMVACYGTFRDFKASNYTYLNYLYTAGHGIQYLIDAEVDSWKFRFLIAYTNEIYRQYSFNLNVTYPDGTPIENANITVTHYGEAASQDFTALTSSDGSITEQILTMGFYNFTGGNTLYDYNPFSIAITDVSGYLDYSGNFTLDETQALTIILTEEPANWIGLTLLLGLLCCVAFVYALTSKD